jgi:hypothetical protein
MLVPLNFRQINRTIKFPIYELPSEDIYSSDGLLFLNGKVLDDRNQPGKTLGERRLLTPHQKALLSKSYPTFIDLVQSRHALFIDSSGVPFRYDRNKMCTVESRRIKKKVSKGTYTLLYVDKVNNLYYMSRYPAAEEWAQILYLDQRPWLLYSVSEAELKTFRRVI